MKIITQTIGGIGNQMFQYAFGKTLAQHFDAESVLDINGLGRPTFVGYQKRNFALSHLNISNLQYIYTPFHKPKTTNRNLLDYGRFFAHTKYDLLYKHIYGYNIIRQHGFEHKSEYISDIKPHKHNYIVGFWQSEKFFEPIANQIKQDFKLGYNLPEPTLELIHDIHNTNSIAINVRRADFVNIAKAASLHDVCTTKYYQDAIDYISDIYTDSKFFVFSDDMQRCRDNLHFATQATYVDPKIYKGYEYELYMYILGQCKHYIIPNSSFARWAVYLGRDSSKTVIIPDRRFNNNQFDIKDLIPDRRKATKLPT